MTETDTLDMTVQDDTPVVATPPLAYQVIPYDDGKIIVRNIKLLMKYGVGVVNVCMTCKERNASDIIRWSKVEATGEIVMSCACTQRTLRGVRV